MDDLPFKIVKSYESGDELVALVSDFAVCKAAFEKALFVFPNEHIQMRQGARIILKSKEESIEPGAEHGVKTAGIAPGS